MTTRHNDYTYSNPDDTKRFRIFKRQAENTAKLTWDIDFFTKGVGYLYTYTCEYGESPFKSHLAALSYLQAELGLSFLVPIKIDSMTQGWN